MTETENTESAPAPAPKAPQSLIIRPWPKVVFLYPIFVVATLFWLISMFTGGGGEAAAEGANAAAEGANAAAEGAKGAAEGANAADAGSVGVTWLGNFFMIVFILNILVFAFDFSRIKTITIAIAVIALILGVGWANSELGWFAGIKDVVAKIDIQMNTQFYGFISGFLAFTLALVFVNTRFNYYEINHRELLHHHGYLGDITRMPTTGLLVHKEIYDLMEYVLLRSGRLIFYPQSKREAIVIDNVMNVNRVEDHIKDLLSVVAVRMSHEGVGQVEH